MQNTYSYLFYILLSVITAIFIIKSRKSNNKIIILGISLLNIVKFLFTKYYVHSGSFSWSYDDYLAKKIINEFLAQNNIVSMFMYSFKTEDRDGVLIHFTIALIHQVTNIDLVILVGIFQVIFHIYLSITVIELLKRLTEKDHYTFYSMMFLFTDWVSFPTTDLRPENLSIPIFLHLIVYLIDYKKSKFTKVNRGYWVLLFLLPLVHFLSNLILAGFLGVFYSLLKFNDFKIWDDHPVTFRHLHVLPHLATYLFYRNLFINITFIISKNLLHVPFSTNLSFILSTLFLIIYFFVIIFFYYGIPLIYNFINLNFKRSNFKYNNFLNKHLNIIIKLIILIIIITYVLISINAYLNHGTFALIIQFASFSWKIVMVIVCLFEFLRILDLLLEDDEFRFEDQNIVNFLMFSSALVIVVFIPLTIVIPNLGLRLFSFIFMYAIIITRQNPRISTFFNSWSKQLIVTSTYFIINLMSYSLDRSI